MNTVDVFAEALAEILIAQVVGNKNAKSTKKMEIKQDEDE